SLIGYLVLLTDFTLLVPLAYTIGKRYGIENEALIGACFLPLGIGNAGVYTALLGAPLSGWISDKIVIRYKAKRGEWYPEDRLRASLFGCFIPITVLASALITKYIPGRLGLTLNLICLFTNGIGVDIALTPCGAYAVDVLHSHSAEVTAAINLVPRAFRGWMPGKDENSPYAKFTRDLGVFEQVKARNKFVLMYSLTVMQSLSVAHLPHP
ncbi:hypothetical protein P691DRAFT_788420, partial [Macrolepiota fuliginosa MF-IS2]